MTDPNDSSTPPETQDPGEGSSDEARGEEEARESDESPLEQPADSLPVEEDSSSDEAPEAPAPAEPVPQEEPASVQDGAEAPAEESASGEEGASGEESGAELPVPAEQGSVPVPASDEVDASTDEVDGYRMTLLEHLLEMRNRMIRAGLGVIVGLCIALPFGSEIFDWLTAPAVDKFPEGSGFIYTEVAEKFLIDLKMGFFGALFLAAPVIAWQIWGFVAPGLYKRERKLMIPFVFFSTILFASGAAVCYYGILPYAMNFFLNFATDEISAQIKVASYLRFVTRFILAFGLVFETPLVIFFLARLGLVTATGLKKFRRYAVVLGFVLAAVITPPDPGSQIAVALPFILLYEVGILAATWWGQPPLSEQGGD